MVLCTSCNVVEHYLNFDSEPVLVDDKESVRVVLVVITCVNEKKRRHVTAVVQHVTTTQHRHVAFDFKRHCGFCGADHPWRCLDTCTCTSCTRDMCYYRSNFYMSRATLQYRMMRWRIYSQRLQGDWPSGESTCLAAPGDPSLPVGFAVVIKHKCIHTTCTGVHTRITKLSQQPCDYIISTTVSQWYCLM